MNYFYLYSSYLKKFYFPNPDKKLKVVFDCLNNPTSLVLKRLFKKEIQEKRFQLINADLKKSPQSFNPLEKGAISNLQSAVRRFKADFGVVFDFDGDRVFFVDNKSRFVQPEAIARLLIWQLKPKRMIIDVTTGWLVKRLQASGVKRQDLRFKIFESKVGHYFIKKLMKEKKTDFGAEHSGHYYFKKFFYLDSGILAAIEVINTLSKLPYKISDFVDLLPQYYRSEIDFKRQVSGVKSQEFLKKIETYYRLKTQNSKLKTKISHLDGLTMEFADWWFNLRFSQTEPLLRLNIEAVEKSELKKQVLKLRNYLN